MPDNGVELDGLLPDSWPLVQRGHDREIRKP
jgi:hypothetical protein